MTNNLNWLYESLRENLKSQKLTDEAMKDMVPMFVNGDQNSDHKCGTCSMRVEGDSPLCTVVEGEINLNTGVCNYWSEGEASSKPDIHLVQMSKKNSGYVEFEGNINCSSCRAFNQDKKSGYCNLWLGVVDEGDCCMAWEE